MYKKCILWRVIAFYIENWARKPLWYGEQWESRRLKLVCGAFRKILLDTASLIFTSTLEGVDWPAASPLVMNRSTHWTGGWWAQATVSTVLSNRTYLALPEFEPRTVQPVAIHSTDCTFLLIFWCCVYTVRHEENWWICINEIFKTLVSMLCFLQHCYMFRSLYITFGSVCLLRLQTDKL